MEKITMNFSEWHQQFKKLKSHTSFLLISNICLIVLLGISLVAHISYKPVVIVHPMISNEALEVKSKSLTKSYARSFSLSMALLIGNVTADSAPFIIESIANYVKPEYLAKFRKKLVEDLEKLKTNRLDMTFTATNSYYDDKTNEVVIDGIVTIYDATGSRITNAHQYRFTLEMNDYVPKIVNIVSNDIQR